MKQKMRKTIGLWLAAAMLLSATVLAPAAGAAEDTLSLAEADISITEVCYYDGRQQTPAMTVTLYTETLEEGRDYSVTYQDNVDAGTASVTVTGEGIYSGSQTKLFTIHPRKVKAEELSFDGQCIKVYDEGFDAFPTIELEGALGSDEVEVTYEKAVYATKYVGRNIPVTVSGIGFAGKDGGNYELEDPDLVMEYEKGIISAVPSEIKDEIDLARGYSLNLRDLFSPEWRGEITYEFDVNGIPEGWSLDEESLELTAKEEAYRVTMWIHAVGEDVDGDGTPEYESLSYQEVEVIAVDKEEQADLFLTVEGAVASSEIQVTTYYGQTLSFDTEGGSGTGEVTFSASRYGDGGSGTIDQRGTFTPTEVGKVKVSATKAGDGRYKAQETTDTVVVTILPAPLTIQVKDKTAHIGDAIPALTAQDYTVTGLVGTDQLAQAPTLTYAATPDMGKAGSVAIQAAGAVIPNGNYDPNITYLPGTLTIQEKPSYRITLQPVEHGTIVSDLDTAKEGDTVTLTTKPAEGYLVDTLTVTSDASAPGTVSVKDMGEGIYTVSMPAGNVTVSGTMVPEEATPEWPPFPFDDVSEDDWYYDSVYYVYAYGLMNGTAEATFSPENATTRGMLVTILYRMEGSPQGGGWSPFTDVDPELYYAQPIAWAAWNGIVKGITETTFSPDAPVTRQQMAAILYRYAAWKKWDVSQQGNLFQFTDWEQIQEYARTPLAWASAAGLIQGKENNILDPAGTATRAQVATILQRFHSAYVAPAEEEA